MSYADVNGISLYYEEHGSGQPLILLHGGYGTGEMFAPILPLLASGRRVITVDLQGHGRTADVDRPLRFQTMGDDIAALIRHLGLAQADVMGYSLGAAAAPARRELGRFGPARGAAGHPAEPHALRPLLLARPGQRGHPVPGRGLTRAARAHGALRR